MTAQINDTVFHRKIDFALAGISGSGLFDPATLGFKPASSSSACWRGHVAHYTILDGGLFLTSLEIGIPHDGAIRGGSAHDPELFGVPPKSDETSELFYEGFRHPIAFTGGLLLADGFIRSLYVHMGFHPAWKYEDVREVRLEAGRVTADTDRSAEMAAVRAKNVADKMGAGAGVKSRMRLRRAMAKDPA